MSWQKVDEYVPCCCGMDNMLSYFPYYRAYADRNMGIIVQRGNDRMVFAFCPFCGLPTREVDE